MTNLGFIGVGGYGRAQLENFLPFHRAGRVRITALADVSSTALEAASGIDGLERAQSFTDYAAMLSAADLDAVVISAPIPLHEEMTRRTAERGLFALVEKPPVPLWSQLEGLIAADPRAKIMVGFQHVYSPLLQRMKEITWGGDIGQPLAFSGMGVWPRTSAYYDRAGWAGQLTWRGRATLDGPCTNGMSHFVNSLFFAGGETRSGFATPRWLEGEAYRARPVPSYDVGALRGELDNGCEVSALFAHASADTVPVCLQARGTKGSVTLTDNNKTLCDHAGRTTAGSDGRSELVLAFLEMTEGRAESNLTPLTAMRDYVLATNMMLQSSGGIHQIADQFVTVHDPASPGAVYGVAGLKDLFSHASERGASLRAVGAPWAIAPQRVRREEYDENRLLQLLREGGSTRED